MNQLVTLARVFASLSLLTLGGGMAAYPTLADLTVDVHGWLTLPQLDSLYSVGQAAPGPNMMMIVSIGALTAGLPGALIVFLAFFGPTALLVLGVGRLWKRLQDRPWILALQRGLTPVSIGLLLAGCLTFAKGAVSGWVTALVALAVFAMMLRYSVNPAFLVLGGAIAGACAFGHVDSGAFDFGLIGDVPYTADDVDRKLPNLVSDLNSHKQLQFVVHDGDIKGSLGVPCTPQLFADRHRRFERIAAPFVLLFGDNEWRDCESAGDPMDRRLRGQQQALALLRNEFAGGTYPASLNFHRHSPAYPEIVHWTVERVRFVGLNVPGPDDNNRDGYQEEYQPRNAANIAELKAAFAEAVNPSAGGALRAIMIIFQARPLARHSLDEGAYDENPKMRELMATIEDGARAVAPRPVVLVHGDSHKFLIDQPVKAAPNLTRVSTFGTPFVHWIRVTADPDDPAVFAFHVQIVQANVATSEVEPASRSDPD